MADRSEPPLNWAVTAGPDSTLAVFEIATEGGVLDYHRLAEIELPEAVAGRERYGLILSGRGPIWLYAYLVHKAHPFAWLAINEPREQAAVVISRHRPQAPAVGTLVPLPA